MLPIENTTAGSVYESYDLLLRFNLALVGEEIVDVRHCLLGVADVPIESLRRIHSHPQALSQCSEFLSTLRELRRASARRTPALAAKHVRDLNIHRGGDRQPGGRRALRPHGVEARHRQPGR
jgi:chorismate mutase/prephenate dehydratase